MALRFMAVARSGTVAGVQVDEVVEGDPIVIGRDEGVDLVLPEPTVSRRHVEVRSVDGGWEIVDLGSRLGSWLNGRRLREGEGVPLREGDEVEMGLFRVVFLGEVQPRPPQGTREVARELARELEAGRRAGWIHYAETARERLGVVRLAAVAGLSAGILGLLAAALL